MEGQYNNNYSSKPNMNNNNKECGIKVMELNRILHVMTPETKLENPGKKMNSVDAEKTPWLVKNTSGLEFPLITNKVDRKTLEKSILLDTCSSVVSDNIDFGRSDSLTPNHQININEKISQFLKWDSSMSEQKNEYYDILLNKYQSKSRLTSGLDDYNRDSGDIDDIPRSNSNHVCWDEDVKYYRYPLESSLSTIDIRPNQSKIDDIPRTQSQPCLLDNYFTEANAKLKKQKNMLDTFWKEIGEIENSFAYSSDTEKMFKKNVSNYPDYNKYNSDKFTNINGSKQSNISQEKINSKSNKEDSSQNKFKNDHTLNSEPHLNIENLMTSPRHICNSPDSIFKRHRIEDLRLSTKKGILAKGVNQITHQTDKDTQTPKMDDYFEKSSNDSQTLCEQCGESHISKNKLYTDKTENSLLIKRNARLRELLGLKPEEKNVLVMLQLL